MRTFLLSCLAALLCLGATPARGAGLMLNPGFEREAAGFPIEWSFAWGHRANCTWVSDVAHTGEHSLKLTGPVCVQSPAFPYDGEVITVSGWLKLERLAKAKDTPGWFTAGIIVISLNKDRKPNGHKDLARKKGTQDWTRYERKFTFAHTTKYVRVQLLYAAKCTGTAWFDDIEVVSTADTFRPAPRPLDKDKATVAVDASQVIGPLPDLWRHIDNSYMTELVRHEKATSPICASTRSPPATKRPWAAATRRRTREAIRDASAT